MSRAIFNRKIIAIVSLTLMLVSLTAPVFAEPESERGQRPDKPLEEVISQQGKWHAEAWSNDGKTSLVTGYTGKYEIDPELERNEQEYHTFEVKQPMAITGVFVPFLEDAEAEVTFSLKDDSGNQYGPYPTKLNIITELKASRNDVPAASMNFATPNALYSFTSLNGILLEPGSYTLEVSNNALQVRNSQTGPAGAYLIKGFNGKDYRDYEQQLKKAGIDQDQFNIDEESQRNQSEEELERQPVAFFLEDMYILEEIKINTWNQELGAEPGLLILVDEEGDEVEVYQANGETFNGVENGIWAAYPNLLLFSGEYYIYVSEPDVVVYDENGVPEFSLSFLPLPDDRPDFTGTYLVDLHTYRTSTMMGPDETKKNTFSLEKFEVTILDKGGGLEIIGRYEGVPFSLYCDVIEEDLNSIVAVYELDVDLSLLPASTHVGSSGHISIEYQGDDLISISVEGEAFYSRAVSSERGGDYNTYEVIATGQMISPELPPYVMTALGRVATTGAFPGPATPGQAAVGLLFPPLAGLLVNVLTERLKQQEIVPEQMKYTYQWFKNKYPHVTDFEIAMQILAVSTPDPDSMFRRDETDSSKDVASAKDKHDQDSQGYDDQGAKRDENASQGEDTQSDAAEQEQRDSLNDSGKQAAPDYSDLPETVTINSGVRGQPTEYQLDRETGTYINPSTGGELNMTHYDRFVKPNINKNRAFNDDQFGKVSTGDTAFDREVRQAEQVRQEQLRKDNQLIKLERKYGVSGADEVRREQRLEQVQQMDQFADQMWIGDMAHAAENVTTGVQVAADTAIDGLANSTGAAGRGIRAGYKVVRDSASSMAKDGMSVNNALSGAVRGASDAAKDFTSSGPMQRLTNTAISVAGNTAADMIKNGTESFTESLRNNAIDGGVSYVSGTVMDAATDAIGGKVAQYTGTSSEGFGFDVKRTELGAGQTRIAIKSGSGYINSTVDSNFANGFIEQKLKNEAVKSSVKLVSGLTDTFVVKPHITNPITDVIKGK